MAGHTRPIATHPLIVSAETQHSPATAQIGGKPLSKVNRVITGLILALIAVELAVLLAWYGDLALPFLPDAPSRAAPFSVDAAAALVLIAAVSVGIERVIEYLWTGVEMTAGSFWPLSAVSKHMTSLTDHLGATINPLVVQGTAAVGFLMEKGTIRDRDATELASFLTKANEELITLRKSATGSQRLTTYAAAASDAINAISSQISGVIQAASASTSVDDHVDLAAHVIAAEAMMTARRTNPERKKGSELDAWVKVRGDTAAAQWKSGLPTADTDRDAAARKVLNGTSFGQLRSATEVAGVALTGVSDFLATFKSNPGRRLLSIQLGIVGGLAIAGLFGLDVLAGTHNAGLESPLADDLQDATIGGILLTGLVMGLGSSPTHELIAFLTKSKEKRAADAAPAGGLETEVAALAGSVGASTQARAFATAGLAASKAAIPFEPPIAVRFR